MEQKDEAKPADKTEEIAEKTVEADKQPAEKEAPKEEKQPAKKGDGWIKFLRIIIWVAVTILLTTALQLRALSKTSSAYADGSYAAKASLGNTLFWIGLILGLANLAWGAYRWFSRLVKEKWKAGKIIGKLIGGGIWRTLAILPVIGIAYFVISPAIITKTAPKTAEFTQYGSVLHNVDIEDVESLSENEKEQLIELLFLPNVKFDTDASSNISTKKTLFTTNAYAGSKVTVLNKAKLSPDKKFVIFYTDTGDDKVSDEGVANMGAMLDEIVTSYKTIYGQDFNYHKSDFNGVDNTETMQKVLASNGIDKNIMNTAMPVYIVNPYTDNIEGTLASYAGTEWNDETHQKALRWAFVAEKYQREQANLYKSAPSLPFIHVQPEAVGNISTYESVAHELGHHYISNYCFINGGGSCEIHKALNEATANYLAINVTPSEKQGEVINGHYQSFLIGNCYSPDKTIQEPIKNYGCHSTGSFIGYPALAYVHNYSKTVPNGSKIIFDSFMQSNQIEYLAAQAGQANYKKVIQAYSSHTILNNYGIKDLNADSLPNGHKVPCYDFCTEDYKMFYSSIRFMYATKSDFLNKTIKMTANDNDITFQLFGEKNGTWQIIESADSEISFTFLEKTEYDTVAFSPINYSADQDRMITISISDSEIEEILEEPEPVEEEDPYNPVTTDDNGCMRIEIKSLMELPGRLYKILSESEFSESEIAKELQQADKDATAAAEKIDFEILTICEDKIKQGISFDQANSIIKKSTHSFHLGTNKSSEANISALVKYEPLTRRAKGFVLVETPDIGLHLYSVTVD